MTNDRPIFIISDLHMGNGSYLDQFKRAAVEARFLRFLDYTADQEARLMILGDLLELWRFSPAEVVDHRGRLLDRILDANPVYIPGNHETVLVRNQGNRFHPLFQRIESPLTVPIGGRYFRFMHGHELDPLFSPRLHNRTLPGCLSLGLALKDNVYRWTSASLPGLLRKTIQYLPMPRYGRDGDPPTWPPIEPLGKEKWNERQGWFSVRRPQLLSRYRRDKEKNAYDVTVVGHSHQVGRYGNWYFNSGCWIKAIPNFLKIWPDGHIEVFDWDPVIALGVAGHIVNSGIGIMKQSALGLMDTAIPSVEQEKINHVRMP